MTAAGQVRIRTTEGDAGELRSLHDWLLHEDGLRGRVRPAYAEPQPGQMGGVLDALVVAVGSGGMGAVLAGALSTWISHRRSDVKLTITDDDGRTVEVDAKRIDAEALVRAVRELVDRPEPPR